MQDLPGPGIEPMSPAMAGGLLTTEPPGKSSSTVSGISDSGVPGKVNNYHRREGIGTACR